MGDERCESMSTMKACAYWIAIDCIVMVLKFVIKIGCRHTSLMFSFRDSLSLLF